jgi:phosphate transport system substrate-binding protein
VTRALLLSILCSLAVSTRAQGIPRARVQDVVVAGTIVGFGMGRLVVLPDVRVTCLSTDDIPHDDVAAKTSNSRGHFMIRIPDKYRIFILLFADTNDVYWPKLMTLSPTANPTALGQIQLDPQHEALSASQRTEVVHIRDILARSDPAIAQALSESLNGPTEPILVGSGTTAVSPLYASWAVDYARTSGIDVSYEVTGSGTGISEAVNGTSAFSTSEAPFNPGLLKEHGLTQFPILLNAVVPVVSLRGFHADEITVDGTTLADIFLGNIKNWNDPRIRKLNPKIALPDRAIIPVHRSDDSGATYLFTRYLAQSNSRFNHTVGTGTHVSWPVGLRAEGNEGVAAVLAARDGSIGYVDYSYATQRHLTYTKLINAAGTVVNATPQSIQGAAQGVDWGATSGGEISLLDRPGTSTWPVVGVIYTVMPSVPANATSSLRALNFFRWTYSTGSQAAASLNFVPLPKAAKHAAIASWERSIRVNGKPTEH